MLTSALAVHRAKTPEGWSTPGRCTLTLAAKPRASVWDCVSPPPLLPVIPQTVPMLTGTAASFQSGRNSRNEPSRCSAFRSIHFHRGNIQFPSAPQLAADVVAPGTFTKKIGALKLRLARPAPARSLNRCNFQCRAFGHRAVTNHVEGELHGFRHHATQTADAQPQFQDSARVGGFRGVHRHPQGFGHDGNFVH